MTATASPGARFTLLTEMLAVRAANQPDQEAFRFLHTGTIEGAEVVTYAQLDARARRIAGELIRRAPEERRHLLLLPPGPDFISALFGCLYAGRCAVPVPLLVPNAPVHLLRIISSLMRDSGVRTALSSPLLEPIIAAIKNAGEYWPENYQVIDVDVNAESEALSSPMPASPTDMTILQYSSGSTSTPKGVILNHQCVLSNLHAIEQSFEHTPESRGMIWLPPYHDMGLMGGILQPIYAGFPVALMSPLMFLKSPTRWLQAVSDYRATTSGGPPFAYDLCVRYRRQIGKVDLSSWRLAFVGAEPIPPETIDRFSEEFASDGFRREAFYPCYGLAEGTLIVTGGSPAAPPVFLETSAPTGARAFTSETAQPPARRLLVGCGKPVVGAEVAIVDPETRHRVGEDVSGEIWIAGSSVCAGYWNRPDVNAELMARLSHGGGPYLRTGDLGFLHDGELFVTGRLKDLIIRNGAKYAPPDIERSAELHAAVRKGSCAAFTTNPGSDGEIILLAELAAGWRSSDLQASLHEIVGRVLEQCGVQLDHAHLLPRGTLPKTQNGKRMRPRCRELYLGNAFEPVASYTRAGLTGEQRQ